MWAYPIGGDTIMTVGWATMAAVLAMGLGPLVGAAVLAVADWRAIFALNLAVGLVLAAGLRLLRVDLARDSRRGDLPDPLGLVLAAAALAAGVVVCVQPGPLVRDLEYGAWFVPFVGSGRWLTPVGAVAMAALALFLLRCATARRPLFDLRGWARAARDADLGGALLLAVALGGVIVAFATADPQVQVLSGQGLWYLLGAALATLTLVVHLRRAQAPLLPRGALRRTPAWGAVLVSFLVGAALVAALIDIPIFARTTTDRDSQLMAALVLVRFLVALPVGAVVGGLLVRSQGAGVLTAAGMALSGTGFALMASWDVDSLDHAPATLALVVCGLGFGVALAPVNAAVLAATEPGVHGVATAMVVVARMVGMLVGISALTTLGLRRYFVEQASLPSVAEACGAGGRVCQAYRDLQVAAGITQEQTVFLGAAVCAVLAGVVALVVLRAAPTRSATPTATVQARG